MLSKSKQFKFILFKILFKSIALALVFSSGAVWSADSKCKQLLINPPSLENIMDELWISQAPKYRHNPSWVYVWKLKKGDRVFVDPKAFRHIPSVQKNIKYPIEMTFIKSVESQYPKVVWKKDTEILYLTSSETGLLGVPSFVLFRDSYTVRNYLERSPFEIGEFVQVGSDFDKTLSLQLIDVNASVHFNDKSIPYIGRYLGVHDADHFAVEVQATLEGIPPLKVKVPRASVYGLISGTKKKFHKRISVLDQIFLSFDQAEQVRFRDRYGFMRVGTVLQEQAAHYKIQMRPGESVFVPKSKVFKMMGFSKPFTPMFNADWDRIKIKELRGEIVRFLNGSARITSHADFRSKSNKEKIKILMTYLNRFMVWVKAAMQAENAGLTDYNKLLHAGVGVCRHQVILLAMALSEAGYPVRLVSFIPLAENQDGHAWLEVDMMTDDGQMNTYIADPSNIKMMGLYWEVKKIIANDPNSYQAKWYLQPERKYWFPVE